MLRFLLKLSIVILLLFPSTRAEKIQLSVSPEFGVMSGTTEYELDITQNYIDDTIFAQPTNVKWHLTSLLEYPLDVTTGGFVIEANPMQERTAWSLSLRFVTSLNDPSEKMLDSDWEGATPIFPYTKFSYTESNAEMSMHILELEGTYRIWQKHKINLSVFGGLRYQKIDQSLKGIYNGWQLRNYDDTVSTNDSIGYFDSESYENIEVLTYEVTFIHMIGGLVAEMEFSEYLRTDIKAGFTRVRYDDVDDHPLRNKLSTSDGFGNGYLGGMSLTYHFGSSYSIKRPFVKLHARYLSFEASGSQTQEWYGDDGATPDDDTGNSIDFVPHTVRSSQTNLGIQLGVAF